MPMPQPRRAWVWVSVLAGAACLAVALAVVSRRSASLAEQAERASRLDAENRELRVRSDELAREIESLRAQLSGLEAAPVETAPAARRADLPPSALEAVRSLSQLRDKFAATTREIEQLRSQTSELEAALARLKEENERLTARENELSENLAGANRLAEALQAEVKSKSDRLAPLELTNQTLRKENQQVVERLSRAAKLTAELEEVNRRREAYLTSILRRYREVTDQYRAIASRLETAGEASVPGATDLARIQNAISLTEDELRQLQGLNAQAQNLQKKIRGN